MSNAHDMAVVGDHPLTFNDYVGQDAAKRQMQVAIKSAKARNARLDHTLIAHPDAGIGKTSLALLAAMEMDVTVDIVSGSMTLDQVRSKLAGMNDRDILILEECHRLFDGGKKAAEWMLHLMQHDILLGPLGPETVPPVTLIATTTDTGKIPEPILQRFGIKPRLESYSDDEGALITLKLAARIFTPDMPLPSDAVAYQIARAAANRPRAMRGVLSKVRDLVTVGEMEIQPDYDITEALTWEGLTRDGLTDLCQRYLLTLHHSDGTAGLRSIAERLGEIPAGLNETERLLIGKGLVERRTRGRILTTAGLRRAKALAADTVAA